MPHIVWLYQRGEETEEYYTKSIERTSYTNELKEAVKDDMVETIGDIDLEEFESLSVVLPNYHTNSLHSNIQPGSIILFHDAEIGDFYAASLVVTTGRDRDRDFVGEIWPYNSSAKTYFICTTQPVRIDLSKDQFRDLFGYEVGQDPIENQKDRTLIAPGEGHQNEFLRNIVSFEDFLLAVRTDLEPNTTSSSEEQPESPQAQTLPEIESTEAELKSVTITREIPDRPATPSVKRNHNFREKVIEAYKYRCAVCGKERWSPKGNPEVEAAHIFPVSGSQNTEKGEGGPDILQNGIALCKLHHWAFDNGWISIDDDYTVIVRNASSIKGYEELASLRNNSLYLPENQDDWPETRFLQAHRSLSYTPNPSDIQ
ncbi:HNH endonuclease [Halococcus salsus]|uniref:HNH endonuclease n=1 Tax=Halococcus salsus TaxID=2162894 RepID=UPI00135BF5AC|nr:HNH endonuclease [Halococcus salsus]